MRIFIFIIMFYACSSKPEYQKVLLNKTLKVYSEEFHENAENYIFKWRPPNDPNNKPVSFDLKNDMFIFTPTIEGNYEIHLAITDISDEIVAEEIFYFTAISSPSLSGSTPDAIVINNDIILNNQVKQTTNDSSLSNNNLEAPKKFKKSTKEKKKNIEKKHNLNFTIQIASWPSLEEARKNQLELIELGIDAYIERYYRKEKDVIWYRVRVGNFKNKEKIIKYQNQIESIIGKKTWLDTIPSNKK